MRFSVILLISPSLLKILFHPNNTFITSFLILSKQVYVNKEFFSCITLTVEHNYISSSSTVGIQLHVLALYVGHLQVVI